MNRRMFGAIFTCGLPVVWAYLTWGIRYSRKPEKYSFEKRFSKIQKLAQRVCKHIGIVPQFDGFEEFYEQRDNNVNHLIVCNHESNMDPIALLAYAKRPLTFVSKKEVKKFPLIGTLLKSIDGQFIDREDLRQELKVFRNIQNMLVSDVKRDIVIFPEGTRNKNAQHADVLEFKPGAFRSGFKSKSPITVLSLYGTFRAFGKFKCKKCPVNLNYLKTLKPEDYLLSNTEVISADTYILINDSVNATRKLNDDAMHKLNKKHFE